MSKLTERRAGQPQLRAAEPAAGPDDEQAAIGIQPRGPDLAAVEARYAADRQAWLDALGASRSGNHAALARLALAQSAYEEAGAALEQARIDDADQHARLAAVRTRRDETQRRAEAIANQSAAWTRIHQTKPRARSLLDRILRRP